MVHREALLPHFRVAVQRGAEDRFSSVLHFPTKTLLFSDFYFKSIFTVQYLKYPVRPGSSL